jgi:hypothetical protein
MRILCLILAAAGLQETSWKDAPKGTVKGTLTFPGPRPKQPVVVYLERADAPKFTPPDPLVIGQKEARFDPPFAVVVAGRKVVFDNDEDKDVDHNVFTLGAEEADFGIFGRGRKVEHVFEKPGEVRLHCSVHKFMDGKLFVAPTPAFAVVEGDATEFSIADVPAGTWTLRTYQKAKRFHDAEIKVEVTKNGTATVSVEMKR